MQFFFSTSPCTPEVEGTVDDLDPFVFVRDEDHGVGIFRNGRHSFFFALGGQYCLRKVTHLLISHLISDLGGVELLPSG